MSDASAVTAANAGTAAHTATVVPPHNPNPYPGLRPFRSDEKHLFFGRERQVDRMVEKLAAHRFLAVVGGSGSGKSSLVNCGLRPALHRGNMAAAGSAWRMAQLRPGSDPIGALARALGETGVLFDEPLTGALSAAELVETTLRLGSLGLVDMVEQADLPPGTNLLVVADQFEELFRFRGLATAAGTPVAAHADAYTPPEDALAFVALLLAAAAQTALPIYVVLTMRSDFLGDCAPFDGLPEAINEGQYLVPRLTRSEIRAAITGPAAVAGREVSPVLVTRLLNDVGDNPDQLSILQHALNRTWAYWENEGRAQGPLELAHYVAVGTMTEALDRHADKAYGELGSAERKALAAQVFKALTDKATDARGTRRPTRLATLAEITGASPDELVAVIDVFRKPSRSFLMPPLGEPLRGETVIDISHESLMRVWQKLIKWSDEEARSAGVYTRLADRAARHARGNADLYTQLELDEAKKWRAEERPTAAWASRLPGDFVQAMDFLDDSDASAVLRSAERDRKRRVRAVGVGCALVVMLAFTTNWIATESSRLNQRRTDADVLLRDIQFAAKAQQAMARSSWPERRKDCDERRTRTNTQQAFKTGRYLPLLDALCTVDEPDANATTAASTWDLLQVAVLLQAGDLAQVEAKLHRLIDPEARAAAESMIDELLDLQTPEIAVERRQLAKLAKPSEPQQLINKVVTGAGNAAFEFRHPVHQRLALRLRKAGSDAEPALSDSERQLLAADRYGSLALPSPATNTPETTETAEAAASAGATDAAAAAESTAASAEAPAAAGSDVTDPPSDAANAEAPTSGAWLYSEREMHERMLNSAGRPESAFAEVQSVLENYMGAFLALLPWPLWKAWRRWQHHRGQAIPAKPGVWRVGLAAAADLVIATGLGVAVGGLTDSTLSIGKWMNGGDAEVIAVLLGLAAGLAYLLLRDAIRLRHCRSFGKIAFDLRPAHLVQTPRGIISARTSLRRNWRLLVTLLLAMFAAIGVMVPTSSDLLGAVVFGGVLWLRRHAGERKTQTTVIDADSAESLRIDVPPRYLEVEPAAEPIGAVSPSMAAGSATTANPAA